MNEFEKIIPEELHREYEVAPLYIKEFIRSGALLSVFASIQKKYSVHVDVLQKAINEVVFILLGVSPLANIYTVLEDNAGISEEHIDEVVETLNTEIFIPLQEKLRKETDTVKQPQANKVPVPVESKVTMVPGQVRASTLVSALTTTSARVPATASTPTPAPVPHVAPPHAPIAPPPPTISATSAPLSAPAPVPAIKKSLVPEIAPPHALMVRTMKADAVATKAGAPASKYAVAKTAEPVAPETKKSSFFTPPPSTAPQSGEADQKPAFSKYFATPAASPKAPSATAVPTQSAPLPPAVVREAPTGQKFLKVKLPTPPEAPAVPLVESSSPLVPPALSPAPTPSTSPSPNQAMPQTKLAPAPAQMHTPPSTPATKNPAYTLDPYRELPE